MANIATTLAKLSGLRKAAYEVANEPVKIRRGVGDTRMRTEFPPELVAHYFTQAKGHIDALRIAAPDLYEDFQEIEIRPTFEVNLIAGGKALWHSREHVLQLVRDIDQIFEIRANSELAAPIVSKPRRVFLSHGRSKDWLAVQAYIERDVDLPTLELAQEASRGQTIIEKLFGNAERCDSAVIVMTGDDVAEDQVRARENVIHEIGFFQGKFGRQAVVVLHEDGVNIPTNLAGVVYVPFPKGNIEAGFHVLRRELAAIYST